MKAIRSRMEASRDHEHPEVFLDTIAPKMITVLTRYRPIVLELI